MAGWVKDLALSLGSGFWAQVRSMACKNYTLQEQPKKKKRGRKKEEISFYFLKREPGAAQRLPCTSILQKVLMQICNNKCSDHSLGSRI